MREPGKARSIPIGPVASLLGACACAIGAGQDAPRPSSGPAALARAEITAARTLFTPAQPVVVRFTLVNPTDETIELEGAGAGGEPDAISLPQSLITGTADQPALFISYENEKPVPILPESQNPQADSQTVLRLAPHTALGAEIDVCRLYRSLRYSGTYRLEWRPPGGQIPPASLCFRVETQKDAVMVTDYGKVTFTLMYDQAPRNVENFLELIRDRFYDGKTIHRIIPGFILQGGSPDGSAGGARPDGKRVPAEFHDYAFDLGTLAMARKPGDEDSASCQFFVSLARLPELDGKYTVIGQARDEESLRTLQVLAALPTDGKGRPLRPLTIRFFTLVDRPASEVRQLEATRR